LTIAPKYPTFINVRRLALILTLFLVLGTLSLSSQTKPHSAPSHTTHTAPKKKSSAKSEAHDKKTLSTKPKPDLYRSYVQMGAGYMGSVLYLSRNVKENNDAHGYSFYANFIGTKSFRYSVQYTAYKPLDIGPTWYNIKGRTYETNIEFIARFPNNKSFCYPFAGISFNTFQGYFTGVGDFLNLRQYYPVNTTVSSRWWGLNTGVGMEHCFGPIVIFGDYRMRIGIVEHGGGLNIMDVCYQAGIRVKLPVPKSKMDANELYRKTNDRYHWF
jgi:hypothetical protein